MWFVIFLHSRHYCYFKSVYCFKNVHVFPREMKFFKMANGNDQYTCRGT